MAHWQSFDRRTVGSNSALAAMYGPLGGSLDKSITYNYTVVCSASACKLRRSVIAVVGSASERLMLREALQKWIQKKYHKSPLLQTQSPGEQRTGFSRRTRSQRNPTSVFWKISTLFRVLRWTCRAISAFSLLGSSDRVVSSSIDFLLSHRQSNHLMTRSCSWSGTQRRCMYVLILSSLAVETEEHRQG